jgi:hypothetical protein
LGITALQKPNGTWCKHCNPGVGCRIYSERPDECRTFVCSWLANPGFAPEWKPDHCRMVVTYNPGENEIVITCDPGYPDVWRRKAYFQQIRQWAIEGRPSGKRVMVCVGKESTLVAPEGEFPLGEVRADDRLIADFVGDRLVGVRIAKKGEGDTPNATASTGPTTAS